LLPIEPLDEERWARFERNLFAAMDGEPVASAPPSPDPPALVRARRSPRRTAVLMGIAAAAVLLAALGGWQLRSRTIDAPLASNPTRLVSGAAPSHLALGDNELDLGADTAVVAMGDDDHGVTVVVERGSVTCTVAPRGARPSFLVQAGDVRVRVVGTRFSVTRFGEGARVEVDHGVVEVSAGSDRLTLRDGQSWGPEPTEMQGGAASTTAPPASTAALTPGAATALEPSALPPAAASNHAPASPRERFEAAARLERTDPARAVALYAQLAAGGGSWGANALFAEARLEADRGRRGEARRLAAQYLSRFPGGPNAADARVLLDGN